MLPFYFKQLQEFIYGLMTHGRFRSTGGWRNSFASGDPYRPAAGRMHRRGARRLTEVPIATVPGIRFPFYSTIHFAFGRASFDASVRAASPRPPAVHLRAALDRSRRLHRRRPRGALSGNQPPSLPETAGQPERRIPALRDPPLPAGLHAARRCATWSARRIGCESSSCLVDEPFYTPACLAPLLERWGGSVAGAGFPSGFFDWKRVQARRWRSTARSAPRRAACGWRWRIARRRRRPSPVRGPRRAGEEVADVNAPAFLEQLRRLGSTSSCRSTVRRRSEARPAGAAGARLHQRPLRHAAALSRDPADLLRADERRAVVRRHCPPDGRAARQRRHSSLSAPCRSRPATISRRCIRKGSPRPPRCSTRRCRRSNAAPWFAARTGVGENILLSTISVPRGADVDADHRGQRIEVSTTCRHLSALLGALDPWP